MTTAKPRKIVYIILAASLAANFLLTLAYLKNARAKPVADPVAAYEDCFVDLPEGNSEEDKSLISFLQGIVDSRISANNCKAFVPFKAYDEIIPDEEFKKEPYMWFALDRGQKVTIGLLTQAKYIRCWRRFDSPSPWEMIGIAWFNSRPPVLFWGEQNSFPLGG
ncbi:hypothetical protein [Zavarzinella formosa]|uniref:hypothetical protein n=1 Tax=Zavarzinella formosa TaxID=360055 RepID=UPI0002D52C66|nr:hypothetical protein [Zavarzinella formosa]